MYRTWTTRLFCVLLLAGVSAAQDLGQVESNLKAQYEGKPLILTFAVRANVIAYDYDGRLVGNYKPDCVAARGIRVAQLKLTTEEIAMTGYRMAGRGRQSADLSEVTVRVSAGGQPWTEQRAKAAMRNITWTVASVEASLPNGAVMPAPGGQVEVQYLLADQPVYRVGESVVRPKVLKSLDPEYTEAARQAKVTGAVAFRFIVEEDGTVSHIRQASRNLGYGLDESAAGTLARWSFEPALRDGKPVKVDLLTEFSFCLY